MGNSSAPIMGRDRSVLWLKKLRSQVDDLTTIDGAGIPGDSHEQAGRSV